MSDKIVSTLRLLSSNKPEYKQGSVCGCRERIDDSSIKEGGLRTKGQFKLDRPEKPLVSFITVVRNNKDRLLKCMQSIWNQTYDNIEYIIIDGCSTDGTLQQIEDNAEYIDYYVSGPDSGIYDAMNKGISLASGSIINLVNSDDWMEETAAEVVVNTYLSNVCDIIVGVANVHDEYGKYMESQYQRPLYKNVVFSGMPFNHQAMFASKRAYERAGLYDTKHKILADFKWVLTAYSLECKFCYISNVFSHFGFTGVSSTPDRIINSVADIACEIFPSLSQEDAILFYRHSDERIWQWTYDYPLSFDQLVSLHEKYCNDRELMSSLFKAFILQSHQIKSTYYTQYEKIKELDAKLRAYEQLKNKRYLSAFLYTIKPSVQRILRNTPLYSIIQKIYLRYLKEDK